MLDEMDKIGFIDAHTGIYATHISHKHLSLHDELQEKFNEYDYKARVAYDGVSV